MNRGLWFAFGIGLSLGAGFALLYAPQAGEATRKKIRDGFDDAGHYVGDAADYLKDQAGKLSAEAQKAIESNKEVFGDLVADVIETSTGAVKKSKSMF